MSKFNLSKGERFNLAKHAAGLKQVRVGLGWNPNEEPGGPDFDLDVSAFAIGSDQRIVTDSHFVFYGQVKLGNAVEDVLEPGLFRPVSNDGGIVGAIDDPDGRRSDGDDDEDMIIHLARVSPSVEQIIICVSICKFPHDNKKDRRTLAQNFSMVDDCYIRLVNDETGIELTRYAFNESNSSDDAMQFARLYRLGAEWEFQALGQASTGSLGALVSMFT